MEGCFLTHDMGTSCDKATLVSTEGEVLKTCICGYAIHFGKDGAAEQDPEDWWRAFCQTSRELLREVLPGQLLAIAVSGQMMACLPVDERGKAVRPAMIWADSRAQRQAKEIADSLGQEAYYGITGMRASGHYSLSKMCWMQRHEPQLYEKTVCFLAAKDYINCRLTGVFATDKEDAAYMHAYDIHRGEWSQTLLDAAGLQAEKMPSVRAHGSVLGTVGKAVSMQTGIAAGVPVVLCPGDGDAATLGAGVVEVGDAYTNIGTSSWVSVLTGDARTDPFMRITKADYFGLWRDSGTMQAGGFSYGWIKDVLYGSESADSGSVYRLLDEEASRVRPGADGLLYLPYLLGERSPWWDRRLCGAFLGMDDGTRREHFVRAVLEGVALHLKMILDIIRQTVPEPAPKLMRIIGGGGKSALWRQIFADVYDLPILQTNATQEAGALGCAVVAGMGIGLYRDLHVIRQFETVKSVTEPDPNRAAYYRELQKTFVRAAQVLAPVSHELWELRQRESASQH